jgi:hypothetical protein
MMRQCVTAVVSRNEVWSGNAASEPYECGWAGEAIVWLRCLGAVKGKPGTAKARVQISPDGMRWVDEGTKLKFPAKEGAIAHARLTNFGNFLRVVADLPKGASAKVLLTLTLKE